MLPTDQAAVRLASHLIATYGEDAPVAAAERAEAMEKIGNAEAARVWAAVSDILAPRRGKGVRADA